MSYVVEPIIEPDLPIVDPHHHLWDFRDRIAGAVPPVTHGFDNLLHLAPLYVAEDFQRDIETGHNVVATVFIECDAMYRPDGPPEWRSLGETEFVAAVAASVPDTASTRMCAGIVGNVDLRLGDGAAPILEAHIEAGSGRFRGIRNGAAWDADPDVLKHYAGAPAHLLTDPAFQSGFRHLSAYDLSFEAWVFEPQLPDVVALAAAFPDTTIILDHVGAPLGIASYAGRREERFANWHANIRALADHPNIVVKLGGLGMPFGGFDEFMAIPAARSEQLAQSWKPYVESCIEAFGVHRCMFESNYPVDKTTAPYDLLWNAFKRLAAGYSDDEKAALFCDVAARTYRLDMSRGTAPLP